MTTTTWHRMTRETWYRTNIDSHDAADCPYDGAPGTLGGCEGEEVTPGHPRSDLRDTWMASERDRRSLTPEGRKARLADLAAEATAIQSQIRSEVRDARLAGTSWAVIGSGLGMTRQAAQQRFTDR
jgi:hypothetical protein